MFNAILTAAVMLLTGMGVFLLGMHIMGDGLERAASKSMRKLLGKVSGNRFMGVAAGGAVTAIIHSSAATTVMAMGFVNAGMMNLYQATSIIMGANIGTTITGVLTALGAMNMNLWLSAPVFIGVVMLLGSKKESVKRLGYIIIGMSLIFIGLSLTGDAIKYYNEKRPDDLVWLFESISNPFVLMLLGTVVTAIVQSSTAVNAIVIMLVGNSVMSIYAGVFIILGTNVGTCITALIAGAGATQTAKQASMIHLLFNIIGTVLFAAVFTPLSEDSISTMMGWLGSSLPMQIAWFNLLQNIICTLVMLPFIKQLVWLSGKMVGKSTDADKEFGFNFISDRFTHTPSIALTQCIQEILRMARLAGENIRFAMDDLLQNKNENTDKIQKIEEKIDKLNVGITNYLVKLSTESMTNEDTKRLGTLFHVVSDIERIGDHATNLSEFAAEIAKGDIALSESAISELKEMYDLLSRQHIDSIRAFETRDLTLLDSTRRLEEKIDEMKTRLERNHIERLHAGECSAESGLIFYGIITNLERVGDHYNNIALSVKIRKENPMPDMLKHARASK